MNRTKICRRPGPAANRLRSISGALSALVASSLLLAVPYLLAASNKQQNAKQDNDRGKKVERGQNQSLQGLPSTDLTESEAIAHALNRLGYGPRPGDIERVKRMGLGKWIDQQLHPESLDAHALDARLRRYTTLTMSSTQLMEKFPAPRIAARRQGMSLQDFQKQQQERRANQRARQQGAAGNDPQPDMAGQNNPSEQGLPANAMTNFRQMDSPQRVVAELAMAKADRAIYSERQLYEQMVDFWFNHFNVFAGKGADRWLLTSYERDAIRPHAMGKFRDLLGATAKSPAMLFYLDNWQSVDPQAWASMQQQLETRRARNGRIFGRGPADMGRPGANPSQAAARRQQRGLNENYSRELMELHTLGVDGGYAQQDVVEVARAFTGWTIRQPQRDPEFWFNDRLHDDKPKLVMGRKINAGGIKDGEAVLDLLARDPHTARHLSFKIAQQFVSDNPPAALVERMAKTYLESDGDIRAVLHAMIYSREFWAHEAYRAKIKTPFELVVSAARAVGADVEIPLQLVQWTGRIGEPLYQCQPPTGYSATADAWVNTGALLNRLNYSLALADNRLRGVTVDIAALLGSPATDQPKASLNRAIEVLLSGEVSQQTRQTLEKQMADPQILQASLDDPVEKINQGIVAGLVLGSPEFQRR